MIDAKDVAAGVGRTQPYGQVLLIDNAHGNQLSENQRFGSRSASVSLHRARRLLQSLWPALVYVEVVCGGIRSHCASSANVGMTSLLLACPPRKECAIFTRSLKGSEGVPSTRK